MADARLLRRLDQVGARLGRLRMLWTLTFGWCVLAITLTILVWLRYTEIAWWTLLAGVPVVLVASFLARRKRATDRQTAAVLIERTYPQLDSRLLTAVQQQPHGHDWNFSFLQSELLTEVFAQLRRQNWHRAVASSSLWKAQAAQLLTLLVCVIAALPLLRAGGAQDARIGQETNQLSNQAQDWSISVEPGNVELERGSSLLVLARFPSQLPGNVELVAVDDRANEVRFPLQKSLDDPLFGGRIPAVERELFYHIEFDGHHSEEYRATPFDYPTLLKADADISFPSYTKLEPKMLEDVRQVTLVEGSSLDLKCVLNKPVASAVLVDEHDQKHELVTDPDNGNLKSTHWTFSSPGERKFLLQLIDEAGRANRDATEFRITVVPNRIPDLKVAFPTRDLRVSPLQELQLNAEASDDYGLQGLGLIYQSSTGEEETIDFTESAPPEETARADHMLAMEQLQAQPNDLLSYYFYADDIGPDGQPRRTFSDIYFAEVRPFEEIFRQVPPAHGAGSGECKKLLELQRQVVAGTWNVIRREQPGSLSEDFVPEVETLESAQSEIKKLTEMLKSKLQDALLKQYADEAIQHMQQAVENYSEGASKPAVPPVVESQKQAQSAYQSLLKLQAREKRMMQAQGQGQGSSSPNRMDQQLQALKLKNDRDRYETERQAKAEQRAADREALQILNRLKELAQRQEDLNNRIQELQSALRNAETREQKQEIERQLQRLQSEQEDLLRNLDDVREKMQKQQNQQQMNDARKQADAARERVMRSSEALKQNQTSRALTEGTRAARDLQNLEEELRKQTSGQFNEALRELRANARELSEQQEKLHEQLQNPQTTPVEQRPSLRDSPSDDRNALAKELDSQKAKLQEILEKTRQLVESAESSEPLLSKKLYDTLRDIRQHRPEAALETASQLTRQGILGDVPQLEEHARKGIQQLQAGIDQAAQSILGDEETALREAQAELAELKEAIRRELALNDPQEQAKVKQSADSSESAPPSSDTAQATPPGQQAGNTQSSQSQTGQSPGQDEKKSQSGQGKGKPEQGSGGKSGKGQKPGTGTGKAKGQGKTGSGEGQGGQQGSGNQNGGQSKPSASARLSQMLGLGGPGNGFGSGPEAGPLTGGDFTQWSDRMRDVEEMLTTPELRAQVAAIRDQARLERINVKRHSKAPDWNLVRTSIYGALEELEAQVAEELARRDPDRKLVPIDRDPIPEKYMDFVKSYYEQLSRQNSAE